MLTRTTETQHRTGFKYECPVAVYKRLDKNYPRYPINLDFYACPTKFAEIHHYTNDERLTTALEKYRMMSAAKVDYSYSQNFVDEVLRLCVDYQRNLNFKRRRLNEEEEDMFSDLDQVEERGEVDDLSSNKKEESSQLNFEGKREG
jgi:hypothetical protein